MKVNELILARCINDEENDFVLGQLYVVDEIHIGQSRSSVRIDGIYCNSIWFKYYDACMNEIDIYHSKYSPYFREEDKKEGFVVHNHRFVPNENGVSIFPIEEEYDFTKHFRSDEDIEEDKEIEEVNFITEHDSFSTIDQYKLQEIINKLIRDVNELKKGK